MTNCQKCQSLTNYRLGEIPICFACICEIEHNLTIEAIIKQAEFITGVSYQQMKIRTRKIKIIDARRYAMKMLYKPKVRSLSFVGDLFDVDHSTVLVGIKKINELIETKQVDYGR